MAFLSPVTFLGSNMQSPSVASFQPKVSCNGVADDGKEGVGHLLGSFSMLDNIPSFTGIHSVFSGARSLELAPSPE